MDWLREIRRRVAVLFHRDTFDRDLEEEMRAHLEMQAEENRQNGMEAEEARYAARRQFGNATALRERSRSMWGWPVWDLIVQDIRYAWRGLRKSPGFAATAVLTLALGIGASTAVFTVVDSVVLKPLAYRDSGRLVVAWERVLSIGTEPIGPNPLHFDLWRKQASAFAGLTLLRHSTNGLALSGGHPVLVGTVTCLPNFFDILQARPLLGRGFQPEDGIRGRDNVAVLSYPLWETLFHRDPGVIGRTVRVADVPRQVIGVLPERFHFPNANALRSFRSGQAASSVPEPSVFLPAVIEGNEFSWNGEYGNWIAIGRLRPGAGIQEATAQLNTIETQIARERLAEQGEGRSGALQAFVQPMQEAVVGESKTGLWLLMAAVLGLMLIACVNLANAQLGRALSRSREIAMRTALGAAAWRAVLSALMENLLLAAAGGAAGILLSAAGLALFRRYAPIDLPRLDEAQINATALLFALGLTIGVSILSGLAPAFRLLGADPQRTLQQYGSRGGTRQSRRLRALLVGFQVFGCTALLLITGLFAKSLLYLIHQERGFETERVAIGEVRLPPKTYETTQSRAAFDDAVLRNLREIPGIESVGLVSAMPLEGETWIEPLQRVDRPGDSPLINLRWVSPGYFETVRTRLVAGRFLEERDRNLGYVIISEGEAKALWGSENPVGGQVRLRGKTYTVIGVVADTRNTSLKSAPARMAYLHYNVQASYTAFFVARGRQSAESLVTGMRQAIWKHAPEITIARVKTLDSQLADSLATERFQAVALTAFGVAALLLAMLGIYGVLSYSVAARRQEIGIRVALGATRKGIYALTLSEAGVPVFAGLAAGLIASVAAGRVIQNLLYGTQTVDATVILVVSVSFLASAVAAAYLPARRATRIDPVETLRYE